jgi:hypothetical protein
VEQLDCLSRTTAISKFKKIINNPTWRIKSSKMNASILLIAEFIQLYLERVIKYTIQFQETNNDGKKQARSQNSKFYMTTLAASMSKFEAFDVIFY